LIKGQKYAFTQQLPLVSLVRPENLSDRFEAVFIGHANVTVKKWTVQFFTVTFKGNYNGMLQWMA